MPSTKNMQITFIGGGNMARSLIGGLISAGTPVQHISVAEPCSETRTALYADFGVSIFSENTAAAEQADVLILAVKPQVLSEALTPLAGLITTNKPLLISVAAGITTTSIENWAGHGSALVRVMPNTPALVRAGISALFANMYASQVQRDLAESIMRAVGTTVWVNSEPLMDIVTAVSGSGPAYFFYLMQAIENAAVHEGLDANTARLLTLETALGAARLALESSESPGTLRARVTSPGGTTEAGIKALDTAGVSEATGRAVAAARHRANELATLLGQT